MLCATVLESSTGAILSRASGAAARADLIEIRADAVAPGELDVDAVVGRRARPLLVTCRPAREGGLWTGTEEQRLDLLRRFAERGAEWIDVEWDAAASLGDLPASTKLVVSRHDFDGTLDVDAGFASLRAVARAHVQKLARVVSDARDGLALLAKAARETKPTIAIGMGFPGVATRLLAQRAGAPWTYAAADPHAPAAPGQLSLDALAKLIRGRRVSRATKALGVIGRPVAHSRSPALVNAVLATLGIDAVYAWLETGSPEELLADLLPDAGWVGFSVTIPHKETVARACARLSADARATGAVNTIVRSGDEWIGHNTDAPAVADVLARLARPRDIALRGLDADVLGAGGAARAAAFALREAGCSVRLFDRTDERGRRVAGELGVAFAGPLAAAKATGKPRALVNATSVGMTPDVASSPVDASAFDEKTLAIDLVYTPEATRFLALAGERGAATATGVEIFVAQARRQLELWFGKHVAVRVSDEWLAARVRSP